jgi:hypothetical protein
MYQLLFKHFTMMFSMALPKNKVGGPGVETSLFREP